jgi:phosphoribosylformimino-5-aminoimidazole carboxamide ribotide isomerase
MLTPIPAIDIIEGQCVRLSKGDYASKKVYSGNPLDMAREFEAQGFKRIHLVDLDGAKSSHVVNLSVLRSIATNTRLTIDFGGGIKTDADLQAVFDNGAAMATIGSVAVKSPALFDQWLRRYGAERLILGADVKEGFISINGWKEESSIRLSDFLDTYINKGVTKVLCTDISRDGMLSGTSVGLYRQILSRHPDLYLIASGGVSSLQDLADLDEAGVPAVVFGKAIYEGRIRLDEVAARFLQNSGTK